MARWHVWVVVLAGVGLLMWGVLNQMGVGAAEIGEVIKDRTRDLLGGGASSTAIARNVTVTGAFSPSRVDLTGSPVASLSFGYGGGVSGLTVNGVSVVPEQDARVVVESYEGTLLLNGRSVTLDGDAARVRINGVALHTGSSSVKVRVDGLEVRGLEARDIDARRLGATLTGTLNVQDRVVVTMNNEPLELEAFLGTVALSDALVIDGKARRVFVSGKDYTTVVS